ncbi:MAG: DNA polymerase IV, partial [Calditrichaeota bacterium]
GIYVRPHGNVYSDYSRKFFEVLHTFSPLIEGLSIDEAFMDMTGSRKLFGEVSDIGRKIKEEIFRNTQLTASVGIAPTKSVAKIASDFNKPDGLTIVHPDDVRTFLDSLPVTKLWGIGKKTQENLEKMGIHTVYQLRQHPREVLERKFGKMGLHIYKMAVGEDERSVNPAEDVKSVSNETTYDEDTNDSETVRKTVFYLSEKVAGRLRRSRLTGQTVQLKIRFSDFKTYTRSLTLHEPTSLTDEIFQTTELLLTEFLPLENFVRLVGVGVSSLKSEKGIQLGLWDQENQKKLKLEQVLDALQDKYGSDVIRHAASISRTVRKKKES